MRNPWQVISETFAQLYNKGLSLKDISQQTGKAKSVIRENLARAGIERSYAKNRKILEPKFRCKHHNPI